MSGPKSSNRANKGAGGCAGRTGGDPNGETPVKPAVRDGGGIPIGMPVDRETFENMKRNSRITDSITDVNGEKDPD